MRNKTQIVRYKKLLSFIDEHFKEDIDIGKIEEVCHYSYRNINRIFEAIHRETIGKYIKRLRLERAAQYLKYSDWGVSDIAYEVGFEDRAAFSKAFKNKYGTAPSAFRLNNEAIRASIQSSILDELGSNREELVYEIVYLPEFEYLFLEYRGSHEDDIAVEKVWDRLINYGLEKMLLSDDSLFMTEIVDDDEISDDIRCRYNFAIFLSQPLDFEPDGLFRTKKHPYQKYAKFTHLGSHESCVKYYKKIYAFWMLDVGLELEDLNTLEFYPNLDEKLPPEELVTEIYLPVA